MIKGDVVSFFGLSVKQVEKIEFFTNSIIKHNEHTNLIGKSTITSMWDRHILDCLQLTKFINNKKFKILDMGTGAGLPGVLLSILGYQNVTMIESIKKKTDFVNSILKELSLSAKIVNKRIERLKISQQDIIISRALAPLTKLLTYARMHSNKNTTSLFLKGKNVNKEIDIAMKYYVFDIIKTDSISSGEGCVLQIKNIKNKNV